VTARVLVTITFVNGSVGFCKRSLGEGLDVPVTKLMSKSKCHNLRLATSFVTVSNMWVLVGKPFIVNPLTINGLAGQWRKFPES
jgi:hypothetical protein